MQVITLLNEKGGVGKTTTSNTVAAGLAIAGYKVLLIDADPQGSLTESFGMKKFDGLVRLLAQEAEWTDVVRAIPSERWAGGYKEKGQLYVVPGHLNLRGLPAMLSDNFMILRERLEELEGGIDVVIIDTSPTPSVIHGLAYLASDAILFPVEAEYLAMRGLASSRQNMQRGNKSRQMHGLPPIHLLGVLPTKVEERTKNHSDNIALLNEHLPEGELLEPIMKRTVWRDASQNAVSIFAYKDGEAQRLAENEAWRVVEHVQGYLSA